MSDLPRVPETQETQTNVLTARKQDSKSMNAVCVEDHIPRRPPSPHPLSPQTKRVPVAKLKAESTPPLLGRQQLSMRVRSASSVSCLSSSPFISRRRTNSESLQRSPSQSARLATGIRYTSAKFSTAQHRVFRTCSCPLFMEGKSSTNSKYEEFSYYFKRKLRPGTPFSSTERYPSIHSTVSPRIARPLTPIKMPLYSATRDFYNVNPITDESPVCGSIPEVESHELYVDEKVTRFLHNMRLEEERGVEHVAEGLGPAKRRSKTT
ncbi:uncharacterized protein LOC116618736 [Nematostella vectensis]|uniref:uncharacterized protein LOC116618736 n=1 Tax=Nematostella vectensis TaxID=45351 RepID=UPI0020771F47|nr:uncharacterized protein LOC116618736 [Nematostella vectensis]